MPTNVVKRISTFKQNTSAERTAHKLSYCEQNEHCASSCVWCVGLGQATGGTSLLKRFVVVVVQQVERSKFEP